MNVARFTFLPFNNPLHQKQYRDTVKFFFCFFLMSFLFFVLQFQSSETRLWITRRQELQHCLHITTAVAHYWGYIPSNIHIWVEHKSSLTPLLFLCQNRPGLQVFTVFFQLTDIRFTGIFQLEFSPFCFFGELSPLRMFRGSG